MVWRDDPTDVPIGKDDAAHLQVVTSDLMIRLGSLAVKALVVLLMRPKPGQVPRTRGKLLTVMEVPPQTDRPRAV